MKKLLLVVTAILTFSVLGCSKTNTGDIGRYQLYSCKQSIAQFEVTALFLIDTKTGRTYRGAGNVESGKYVTPNTIEYWTPIRYEESENK